MPAHSRKNVMDPDQVETHHVWSRCVGRAFLFGVDPLTGQDCSHRLQWLESLSEYLASVFAVDNGNYHWLSNHCHSILRSRPDVAHAWGDEEVCWRWKMAWPQFDKLRWSRSPTDEEIEQMLQRAAQQEDYIPNIRRNLASISWHQARLKEPASLCTL